MKELKEIQDYRKFTKPSELHKAVNTLRGIVAGITTDYKISDDEVNELSHWCLQHANLIDRHPFNELIPMIQTAYQDGILEESEANDIVWLCNNFVSDSDYYNLVTSGLQFLGGLIHGILEESEANDIVWLCNNFVSDSDYYNLVTSGLQFLGGLIHGILADGVITDSEIHTLKSWITSNDYLAGCYPFDEIESLLLTILMDGKITEDERNMLTAFLSNFIDLKYSYNLTSADMEALKSKYSIGGICSVCQSIDFKNNLFCFTGQSTRATRNEIATIICHEGGNFKNNLTNSTRYLIVGNDGNPCWAYSCYGRKIEDAINRRKAGQRLTIVNEIDFWDIIDDLCL